MSSDQYDFKTDIVHLVSEHHGVSTDALKALCDWVYAPVNLQQFTAVVKNIKALLEVQLDSELKADLAIDMLPTQEWTNICNEILANQSQELPKEISIITANKLVRPANMISLYPVYATLVGSDAPYPEDQVEKIRAIHMVGMAACIAYEKSYESKIIQGKNTGFESALREIRNLEHSGKRPKASLPDFQSACSLSDVIDVLELWREDNENETWGGGLSLLLKSVRDDVSRRPKRFRLRIRTQEELAESITLSDEDQANTSDTSTKTTSLTVNLISRTPHTKSAKELLSIGLHPHEMSTHSKALIHETGTSYAVQSDETLIRKRNYTRIHQAITNNAQSLIYDPKHPTAYELGVLHDAVLTESSQIKNLSEPKQAAHAEMLLILILHKYIGRSLEELHKIDIFYTTEDYNKKRNPGPSLVVSTDKFVLPVNTNTTPASFNALTQELLSSGAGYLHPKSKARSFIELGLDNINENTMLLKNIAYQKLSQQEENNTAKLFTCDLNLLTSMAKEFLKETNREFGTAWSLSKISRVMQVALDHCYRDQALTQIVTQRPYGHSVVASHYQRVSTEHIESCIKSAHEWINAYILSGKPGPSQIVKSVSCSDDAYIGSDLVLPDSYLKDLCQHLRLHVGAASRLEYGDRRLQHTHNRLVAYISTWLGLITGYRAVADPFDEPDNLDRQTGLLIISDKDNSLYQHTRLVPVTQLFIQQLDCYINHLSDLSSQLSHKPTIQENILRLVWKCRNRVDSRKSNPLSLLFLLSDSLQARALSPANLKEFLPPLNIRPNANRHYLRTRLIELGAPGELVSYFMGHWEAGEEPYNKFSTIDPVTIASEIRPYIEDLEQRAEWSPLRGLSRE